MATTQQFNFGSGVLIGTPTQDAYGNAISNPSPIMFGALQDVSIDISADIKELYGQNQFPITVGRGKAKIGGKAKMAQINGLLFNELFFGQALTSGIFSNVIDTTGAPVPATPFQITPVVPSAGTWARDLGVRNANGIPLTRVASAPTTGQYAVTAGVYTFAAADTGLTMFINFQYTATAAAGIAAQQTQIVSNVLMGQAPSFQADFYTVYQGNSLVLSLYQCVANKLTIATKIDDFTIPEFDFSAFANAAGKVMQWQTSSY